MSQIPSVDQYEAFINLIRIVTFKSLKHHPEDLIQDICHDVYEYFLRDEGRAYLERAETMSYLKTQIYYRVIDSARKILKPLKTSTLESQMKTNESGDSDMASVYDGVVDAETDIERSYADQDEYRYQAELMMKEIKRLTPTVRSSFVIHYWEELNTMCDQLQINNTHLLESIKTPLALKDLRLSLQETDQEKRAIQILIPAEVNSLLIKRKLIAHQKAHSRAKETLKTLFQIDNVENRVADQSVKGKP